MAPRDIEITLGTPDPFTDADLDESVGSLHPVGAASSPKGKPPAAVRTRESKARPTAPRGRKS